ncbi:5'/3'-nucleotidase SurE [Alphaproteobacteria bacterium]|nr:5'/3'-nucleotidase SurE [Alphaproteobacteria bacterium]
MNNKNCFFLTNDDGYSAVGLKYLKKIVKQISNDIWVFAPAKNQSAKSHSITINKNIYIRMANKKEYIINGTPSDCVILGLEKIKNKKKKNLLLISGINEGVNLGYDLLYSGTVAAAREGALNNIKSIAISIDKRNNKINWNAFEYFAPKILFELIKIKLSNSFFLNVNFPSSDKEQIKGIKVVKMSERKPGKLKKIDNNNYLMPSERKILKSAKANEDEFELMQGFITVTIHDKSKLIVTNDNILKLKNIFRKNFE